METAEIAALEIVEKKSRNQKATGNNSPRVAVEEAGPERPADQTTSPNPRVGVLCGGPSAEREVSFRSAAAVVEALTRNGFDARQIVMEDNFDAQTARAAEVDVFFPVAHGEFGEDGRLQLVLEKAGVPYIGSEPDASAAAFDKVLSKRIFEQEGVLTPAWMYVEREEAETNGGLEAFDFVPPVVIKPARGGSSLGVSIVRRVEEVEAAAEKAFALDDGIIVERYVAGRELTVAVLGEKTLPPVELRVPGEFYDYGAKYADNRTEYHCPAEVSPETAEKLRETALNAHRVLGCRDLSRTDIVMDARGLLWVLEVNTLPGMTSHSLLPKAAAASGLDFPALCSKMLKFALQRTPAPVST